MHKGHKKPIRIRGSGIGRQDFELYNSRGGNENRGKDKFKCWTVDGNEKAAH